MEVQKLFIDLTQYLTPYKQESMLEPFLPAGIQKDEVGNYYIIIGESKTMFTCHMDNYTKKLTKVNHVFYEDERGKKVKTDGKTPLGSDDKAGVTVMLNMIEHNVPGCYYFFIGEEPLLSVGCKGSKDIFKNKPDWFKRFDRCIAFDRRGCGSIISKQRDVTCCSKEFVLALAAQFGDNNMEYKSDPTGRYTDSAVFMYIIPEVTNLSCGGFHEHTNSEFQNLDYLERVCNATIKINWEELPIVRVPKKPFFKADRTVASVARYITHRSAEGSAADIPNNDRGILTNKEEIKSEIDKYRDRIRKRKAEQKQKPNMGLFNYKTYVKKKGLNLFQIVEDYLEYFGYKATYFNPSFDGKHIYAEFKREDKDAPQLWFLESDKFSVKVEDSKITLRGVTFTDLKNFENVFDIGFDAKFYKYTDNFLNDLRDWCRDKMTWTVKEKDVLKILQKYSVEYTMYDLMNSDLFDDDDFRWVKSVNRDFGELGYNIQM
jgi:hypothetical protein